MRTCTETQTRFPTLMRDSTTSHLYFVDGTSRRKVVFPEIIESLKKSYATLEVAEVLPDVLHKFEPGALVPRDWTIEHWIEPPNNKQQMREIIASQLTGQGVEFGAGSRPMPLPINTSVLYAEPFQSPQQYSRMNYTEDTVVAKLINPIEQQFEIETASQNFVVAAHVIEHTPNPIGAIVESFRCLKENGKLLLVIPDKRRTFDRNREITELNHLIADYENPDRERDLENYIDFFKYARMSKKWEEDAAIAHQQGIDIHYHVWTPSSFHRMFTYIVEKLAPFSSFELKPPVNDEQCLEFYLVATK